MLADFAGLALLIIPNTLTLSERLTSVLHDMFDVLDQIGQIAGWV